MECTLQLVVTEGKGKKLIKKHRGECFYPPVHNLSLKENVDRTGGEEHPAHGKWSLILVQNGIVAGHSALLSRALARKVW